MVKISHWKPNSFHQWVQTGLDRQRLLCQRRRRSKSESFMRSNGIIFCFSKLSCYLSFVYNTIYMLHLSIIEISVVAHTQWAASCERIHHEANWRAVKLREASCVILCFCCTFCACVLRLISLTAIFLCAFFWQEKQSLFSRNPIFITFFERFIITLNCH